MNDQRIIRFDWAIKTILRDKSNFDVLEGFLSALLGEDIQVIQLIESESNQEAERQKFNRVDIMVLDSNGQHMIIEIQNESERDYQERILFGTSKVIVENARIGASFSEIKKVISISILYFNMGQGDDYIYYGSTQFKGLHTNTPLIVRKRMKIADKKFVFKVRNIEKEIFPEYYLIHVERFKDEIKTDIDEWIYMLKNEEIPDHFKSKNIDSARQKLKVQTMNDKDRRSYEQYLIDAAIEKDMFSTAREEGETKGRKEGMEEGEIKGEIKTYQNLLKNPDLPNNLIQQFNQKINALQNKLQHVKSSQESSNTRG
jgi:predicted transposase/invertase (TIGR01784 family)